VGIIIRVLALRTVNLITIIIIIIIITINRVTRGNHMETNSMLELFEVGQPYCKGLQGT
jgi:hypothetical protein